MVISLQNRAYWRYLEKVIADTLIGDLSKYQKEQQFLRKRAVKGGLGFNFSN